MTTPEYNYTVVWKRILNRTTRTCAREKLLREQKP